MGSTHDSLTASNSRGGSTGHANIHRIKPRIKLQLQCSIARQISSHCRLPLCHEQSQGCHCSFNSSRATARVSAAPRPASRTAPDATVVTTELQIAFLKKNLVLEQEQGVCIIKSCFAFSGVSTIDMSHSLCNHRIPH